jgi:hypothetical protein
MVDSVPVHSRSLKNAEYVTKECSLRSKLPGAPVLRTKTFIQLTTIVPAGQKVLVCYGSGYESMSSETIS